VNFVVEGYVAVFGRQDDGVGSDGGPRRKGEQQSNCKHFFHSVLRLSLLKLTQNMTQRTKQSRKNNFPGG
jgi:hypothetical protein